MSDNIQKTYRDLCRLEKQIRTCEQRLNELGQARVPVYFWVPPQAAAGFRIIYQAVAQMKDMLNDTPDLPEG